MRRWILGGLLALVLGMGAVFLWARFFAGGPVRLVPGGHLSGEPATEPITDWSFANEQDYLEVESLGQGLPYSSRVWFLAHDGRLHLLLPSLFGDGLKQRIEADPRVRVRVGGLLYDQTAVAVTGGEALSALLAPVIRRQFAIEVSGEVTLLTGETPAEMWIYRLED